MMTILAMAVLAPVAPVQASPEILIIPEGETMVVDEDGFWSFFYVVVDGTLIIDGVDLETKGATRFPIIDTTIFNVSGTLKVINGARLTGYPEFYVQSGGVIEIHDSVLENDWYNSPYTFWVLGGDVHATNSSIFNRRQCLWAEGGNISLNDTVVTQQRLFEPLPMMNLSAGVEFAMIGSNITGESHLIECHDVGNISIRDGELFTELQDLVTVDGARSLTVSRSNLMRGNLGLDVNDVVNVTIEDTRIDPTTGYACQISWADNVTIDGLTIEDTMDVALNITNCTNVSIEDVDVDGVSGDGIGIMVEYCGPFSAYGVNVRYAKKGMFMIYTDDVTLNNINVGWCQYYGLQLSHCIGVDIKHLYANDAGIDGIYAGYCRALSVQYSNLDRASECGAFLTHTPASFTEVTARSCGQYGVRAALFSTFFVDSDLSFNGLDGFLSLDQGGAGMTDCIVESNGGNGTRFVNAQGPFVKGCRIADNRYAGIWAHYETRAVDVLACDIEGNRWGLVLNGRTNMSGASSITARDTYIHNNTEAGALNWLDSSSNLDARYCWWGNNTGPKNASRNVGGSGDEIFGGVKFKPWLEVGNLKPMIDGPRDITVEEEGTGFFFYSARDWDNDPNRITFGLQNAPGNVSIDDVSGSLTVTPDDPQVGLHSFFITARDDEGAVGRLRVNLTVTPVNDPPRILVPRDGILLGDDEAFDVPLIAVDPDNEPWEMTWSLVDGPAWLSLSHDGHLNGTTSWQVRGDHLVSVRVEDGAGGEDSATIIVQVIPHYHPLAISGLSTDTAFEDLPFRADILFEHDEEADIAWELICNASWLKLNVANVSLEGTPGQRHAGTVSVQLSARDQLGQEVLYETTLLVIPVNDAPLLVGFPRSVTVNSTHWFMDLAPYVWDVDDPPGSHVFFYEEEDERLSVQGSLLVGRFSRDDQRMEIDVYVVDPHGARSSKPLRLIVKFPEEPEPDLSVADLFPWVLIVLAVALGVGILLSHNERRKREREDVP
jgi:hypothetical protein